MIVTFRIRRGTAAAWTAANPVLGLGEPGLETDTRKVKYGNGATAWNSLSYAAYTITSGDITAALGYTPVGANNSALTGTTTAQTIAATLGISTSGGAVQARGDTAFSGVGTQISYAAGTGTGYLIAYDYTGGVYKPLTIGNNNIQCLINGHNKLPGTPTYADNAAAVAGGLATDTLYKTAAGDLRIVV